MGSVGQVLLRPPGWPHRLTPIQLHSFPTHSQVPCNCQVCSFLPTFLINSSEIKFSY